MGGSHAHDEHDEAPAGPKVLAVSKVSPKVRTIAVVRPTADEANYLAAAKTGLGITLKHFLKNILGKRRPADKLARGEEVQGRFYNDIETIQYPEEKTHYPERFRGLHRLMQREDGNVRCVACMCCPTVCPAHCITIVPEEAGDASVEKRPAVFEIDELRCVVCGLCVEACPCDAIRMDSGVHAEPVENRGDAIMTKNLLLDLSKKVGKDPSSIATQGGEGPDWREKR
ncbi:MAG TPA: NADH-quinone oxidoreductase subunit I [Kofleriaceae bacterium]|nr:NADH-quinone oxidoreductase subunit I [Kofleriaceae bacterium]